MRPTNKNLLILNNSISEFDIIDYLIKRKFKVYTLGKNDPLIKKKVTHFKKNYKNVKFIKKIIKTKHIESVLPCANDISLYSIRDLKLNRFLLDGNVVLNKLHNKIKFREYYREVRFNTFSKRYEFLTKKLGNNFLLKKSKSSGGKGITLIKNKSIFLKAINLNFVSKNNFFFEESLAGSDHGVFTLIKNQKVMFSFFDTEQRYINPYTVSSTTNQCSIPLTVQKKFINYINKITKDLKLVDGILHFQVKYKNNSIKIIEVTRRYPGDRYLKFLEISLGKNFIPLIIGLQLNRNFCSLDYKNKNLKKKIFVIRKIIFSPRNGTFDGIHIDSFYKKFICEKQIIIKKKEKINDYLNQRLGVIFFKFKSYEIYQNFLDNINEAIRVLVR